MILSFKVMQMNHTGAGADIAANLVAVVGQEDKILRPGGNTLQLSLSAEAADELRVGQTYTVEIKAPPTPKEVKAK